jgi:hypothetical protein
MRPAALAGAIAGVLVLNAALASAGPAVAQPHETAPPPSFVDGLEPAIAACVLDRLGAVLTESTALLLVRACTRLVQAATDGPNGGEGRQGQLFVRCKVAGDPEWLEFRLVTRQQCASAAGQVQED